MVRGTIVEVVPNDHVTITLVNGQTRTMPMSEVRYAGPASRMPPSAVAPPASPAAAPPAPAPTPAAVPAPSPAPSNDAFVHPLVTVNAPRAHLHVTSDQDDVTFMVKTAEATAGISGTFASVHAEGYDRICTAPCDATLPTGTYTLGLAQGNDSATRVDDPVHIYGDSVLHGHIESRTALRVGGILLCAAAIVAGSIIALAPAFSTSSTPIDYMDPSASSGGGIDVGALVGGMLLVGLGVGLIYPIAKISDKAVVSVEPAP